MGRCFPDRVQQGIHHWSWYTCRSWQIEGWVLVCAHLARRVDPLQPQAVHGAWLLLATELPRCSSAKGCEPCPSSPQQYALRSRRRDWLCSQRAGDDRIHANTRLMANDMALSSMTCGSYCLHFHSRIAFAVADCVAHTLALTTLHGWDGGESEEGIIVTLGDTLASVQQFLLCSDQCAVFLAATNCVGHVGPMPCVYSHCNHPHPVF